MPSDMPSEDDELEVGASEDDVADDDLGADAEVVDAVDELEDDEDEGAPKRKVAAAAPVAVEDVANVEARRQVREQLETDVEAFLRKGGQIVEIADDVRADPPKKPESKYGTRSI